MNGEPVNTINLTKCHCGLYWSNLLILKFNLSNYGSALDGQHLVGLTGQVLCRNFFQERVDRFLMQIELEKILKFRKGLIQIGSKLDFQLGSLLDHPLTGTPQFFEVHRI